MRKSSLILAMCFCATLLSGQTLSSDIKSSPIGKLIYGPYPKDIKKVSEFFDLWGKSDNPDIKDILLLDYYISWPFQVIINVRVIKLNDGRVSIITYSSDRPNSFHIMIKYLDEDEFDPSKVIECHVDKEGLVIELSTKYNIDPNGKEGIVLYNDKQSTEGNKILETDEKIFSPDDLLVQRYQKEINNKILHNGKN